MYIFSKRSLKSIKTEGLDHRLILLLGLMLEYSPYDFVVTETLRTKERQAQLVKEGKSKTMNSRHIIGKAFDIAILIDNKITWDLKYYQEFGNIILKLAERLGFPIECGCFWKTFIDGPHIQIND